MMRGAAMSGVVLAVALFSNGCASVVPHHGQVTGVAEGVPQGLYVMTLHTALSGSVRARIAAEPRRAGAPGEFRANSRPGAFGELIGGVRGWWINLVGRKALAGGAFLHWHGGVDQTTGAWTGRMHTPLGTFDVVSTEVAQPLELRGPGHRVVGYVELEPSPPDEGQFTGGPALVTRIEQTFAQALYDPALIHDRRVRRFFTRLQRLATIAQDETEFLLGFLLAAQELPFSHVALNRELTVALPPAGGISVRPPIEFSAVDAGLLTVRISTFEIEPGEIDAAFARIAAEAPRALILDLRGNPGGTYACVRVADYLLASPIDMGVLVAADGRDDAQRRRWSLFPVRNTVRSLDELRETIAAYGGVIGRVLPREPRYDGPVAVLIDRRTASASEPLVETLQRAGRAVLVGETTAGAMLSADAFALGAGWVLHVPVYDYFTADGVRLEGRGVTPDIAVPSDQAPAAARRLLLSGLPGTPE